MIGSSSGFLSVFNGLRRTRWSVLLYRSTIASVRSRENWSVGLLIEMIDGVSD